MDDVAARLSDDFVIATGKQISVREFVRLSAQEIGVSLEFKGAGVDEVGMVSSVNGDMAPFISEGDVLIRVDSRYFRPAEVETLLGDPSKAKETLGWIPEITVEEMCAEMMAHDLDQAKQKSLLKSHGYRVQVPRES